MLNKIRSEFNFRSGRRRNDAAQMSLAAKQDRYNIRPAMELCRMGSPDAICQSILMTFTGLRAYSFENEIDHTALDFIQLAIPHLDRSRGQCFQDVAALYFSGSKSNGFFVEVGTGNGEQLSNTFMLEKSFGWNGILFEPDRRFHESIRKLRSAKLEERPAYSVDDQAMKFLEVSRAGELSTLSDYRAEDGRYRFGATREVKTVSLNTAFKLHNAPQTIDYISIDTEGSELEVLKGLDLNEYDVRFLTIEHNYVSGKKEALENHLAPYGYKPVLPEFSCQDIWLAKQ